MRPPIFRIFLCLCLAGPAVLPQAAAGEETRPGYLMDSDPELPVPTIRWTLDPKLLPLWKQALARPEADYRRLAAEAVAEAWSEGFVEMKAAQPDLVNALQSEDPHPAAVYAVAHALIAMDGREAAAPLFQAAQQGGVDLRQLIEPALAEWDFKPIRDVWRQRLSDDATRRRDLLLAVAAAGRIEDRDALPLLTEIVLSGERPGDVRLAAARAAGAIADAELERDAAALESAAPASILNRLCAVALLTRHRSEAARALLARLAADEEPAVAAAGLNVLFSIDPELVLPLVERSLESADANVRLHAAEAYIALPTTHRIAALSQVLDDPHPGVRSRIRAALFAHAQQPDFDAPVRKSALQVLAGGGWRGQEQAAQLLAALDHKPAAGRLVELLESQRPEVMATSAWSLRMLAVPETLPALLKHAERQTEDRRIPAVDRQLAHLFEAMGQMGYSSSIPLMRQYIPKDPYCPRSRGGAIWALGMLHAGNPDERLAEDLLGRLTDPGSMPPELPLVHQMSAIALGRMRAESKLENLRELLGPTVESGAVEYALRWAIREISGEELPLAPPVVNDRRGWFLEPLPPPGP